MLRAQLDMRITGPGITPFGPANQQRLINVFADASRNISQSAFRVILVAAAYTSGPPPAGALHTHGSSACTPQQVAAASLNMIRCHAA